MKITVFAFGIAKEIFESASADIELKDETTVRGLKTVAEEKFPALKKLGSYMIAVNNEFADEQTIINPKDEVAIIPPVSGG
jgi:molybdopterin converting factor subunit 1